MFLETNWVSGRVLYKFSIILQFLGVLINCLLHTLQMAVFRKEGKRPNIMKKGTFETKRDPLLYMGKFLKRKLHFHYVLRGAVLKNGHIFLPRQVSVTLHSFNYEIARSRYML